MKFDSIHGTDRIYVVLTKCGRCKSFNFAITGYAALDVAKEKRFRHLLNFLKIKHVSTDVSF